MRKSAGKTLKRLVPALILLGLFLVSSLLALRTSAQNNTPSPTRAPETPGPSPTVPAATPSPTPTQGLEPPVTQAPISPAPSGPKPTPVYPYKNGGGIPISRYTFGTAVPETAEVEDGYFADTVFVGDSRTEGFRLYSGLKTAAILAGRSINVDSIHTEAVIADGEGGFQTIMDALAQSTYRKVYIMLGVNELGYSQDNFIALYDKLIDEIVALQPDALLYIQAIMPVSKARAENDPYYNNERIRSFNSAIAELAAAKGAYYIDTYTAFADEEGNLPDDAAVDGVHFQRDYCERWLQYLKTHTIEPAEAA